MLTVAILETSMYMYICEKQNVVLVGSLKQRQNNNFHFHSSKLKYLTTCNSICVKESLKFTRPTFHTRTREKNLKPAILSERT